LKISQTERKKAMKSLLAVDGNSILNRAFYGIRPLTTAEGIHTNAVYGTVNILLRRLEELSPEYCAVAFDLKAPTFRHREYSEYKAGRRPMPEELAMQLPIIKECIAAMGISVLSLEGYEADDILGTLSAMGEKAGIKSYILTGDRDSLQLISDDTTVLLAGNNDTTVFDKAHFVEEYGITPDRFVDVKAVMGDSSDNIPGVPGIGSKGALKLISAFGDLDGIYSALDGGEERSEFTKSVKQKLCDGRESAYLSKRLSAIEREVPLGLTLDDIKNRGFDTAELKKIFTKLEFSAFIKRLGLAAEARAIEYTEITPSGLSALAEKPMVAAAVEDGVLKLCAGEEHYSLPFSDESLKALEAFRLSLCVYDSKEFCRLLKTRGVDFAGCAFDVMLAAYLENTSDGGYSLERLCSVYLGEEYEAGKTDTADTVYRLYLKLSEKLAEDGQEPLYFNTELPLAAVLADMELCGFRIDREGLYAFGEKISAMEREYTEGIYNFADGEFNINSPKQLGEVLFEKLQLPALKKTKSGYSTNAETLEKLLPYHPIINLILEYRKVSKLRSTYVEGLLKVADSEGRVHTSFNQAVTATGRLSSTEPNLQNIPIRTELGRELRRFFIPKNDDYLLIDADYSQIELRLLAAIAEDETMISAFRDGVDIHTLTASQVFGVPIDAVTSELRKRAKAVNFGIVYGIGDFSLAADIGVTKKQAGEYIKSYLAKYPGVSSYLHDIVEQGKRDGYVTTLFGRRRYIPELSSGKATLRAFGERVAMNSPIQGTAADVIKIAMINTAESLKKEGIDAKLILQVHDELIVEAHKDCAGRAAEILKYQMENAVSLSVPLTVEISSGKSWYDCK